jgi:hypothetical protein
LCMRTNGAEWIAVTKLNPEQMSDIYSCIRERQK